MSFAIFLATARPNNCLPAAFYCTNEEAPAAPGVPGMTEAELMDNGPSRTLAAPRGRVSARTSEEAAHHKARTPRKRR